MPEQHNNDSGLDANERVLFNVTANRNIGIGIIFGLMLQLCAGIWAVSAFYSSITDTRKDIAEVQKQVDSIKTDIYTRKEASIQFEAFRREIDGIKRDNDRQDDAIRDLKK